MLLENPWLAYRDDRDQKWEVCGECQARVFTTVMFGLCGGCWAITQEIMHKSFVGAEWCLREDIDFGWFRRMGRAQYLKWVDAQIERVQRQSSIDSYWESSGKMSIHTENSVKAKIYWAEQLGAPLSETERKRLEGLHQMAVAEAKTRKFPRLKVQKGGAVDAKAYWASQGYK